MNWSRCCALAATTLLAAGVVSAQPVRFVDAAAVGANNGLNWQDAYTDLQTALAAAAGSGGAVTQLWVADGVYKPSQTGSQATRFQMVAGVSLYGGFAGGEMLLSQRDPSLNITTLSGDLGDNDNDSVSDSSCCSEQQSPSCDDGACAAAVCTVDSFCCDNRWDAQCVLRAICLCGTLCDNRCDNSYHVIDASGGLATQVVDGFTITGGFAYGSAQTDRQGGGAVINSGSIRFVDCVFRGNGAMSTGGAVSTANATPRFQNCRFEENEADIGGALRTGTGGSTTVVRSTFAGNEGRMGGAVSVDGGSTNRIVSSSFFDNAGEQGAAIQITAGTTTVANCVLHDNHALTNGGAMRIVGGTGFVLANSTVAYNTAAAGGGVRSSGAAVTMVNSILWGNSDGSGGGQSAQVSFVSPTPTARRCLIDGFTGGLGGTANFAADPLFVNPAGLDGMPGTDDDDFSLHPDSPAVDAGHNAEVPADAADLDNDGNVTEPLPVDRLGLKRFAIGPFGADTGAGTGPLVDLGAIEQNDCNGNGVADTVDVSTGGLADCNANQIPDACEFGADPERDCDDDLILDSCEIATRPSFDLNQDGILDVCQDCNGNTVADFLEIQFGTAEDCNNNLQPDECDTADATSLDCQEDAVPDECQLAGNDCDANGVPDECDIASGLSDCNTDGVPDGCQPDFDGDDVIDECDDDIDDDGVPNGIDVCNYSPMDVEVTPVGASRGDVDGDCDVDIDDFFIFEICLSISGPGRQPILTDCVDLCDLDDDSDIDLRDLSRFQRGMQAP